MKKGAIFLTPLLLTLSIMRAATTTNLSLAEQTVASFYDNLKILSTGKDSDASYEAGESCIAMVASSETALFFPNEFKKFGLDGSHDESDLIFKSYVSQFKRMAFSHNMTFSYRITETLTELTEAEFKKADEKASFIHFIVEKKYGASIYNGIIRDTILFNCTNNKISGIRNFAGGNARTDLLGHGPMIQQIPVTHPSQQHTAYLQQNAAYYYSNKRYTEAFNSYQEILKYDPQNSNAYFRLAIMSYRRQGCSQFSRKKTDMMAMEYINKAYDYGDWSLKSKIENIKYYW